MKAAFGLRFLPAFFAFFFAISVSPLNVLGNCVVLKVKIGSRFHRRESSSDVKMPNKLSRVNAFQREIAFVSLDSRLSATPPTVESPA
jgi:hypothetical protein